MMKTMKKKKPYKKGEMKNMKTSRVGMTTKKMRK